MSLQDPIADMLTRLRNGQRSNKKTVEMPSSKIKKAILEVLKQEGFIGDFHDDGSAKPKLTVELRYHHGRPVIEMLQRRSRPGLRQYFSKDDMPEVMDGLGIAIVSTSKGVMSGRQARALGEGGEILCYVA